VAGSVESVKQRHRGRDPSSTASPGHKMRCMEETEQPGGSEPREDMGEDHREGPPGYDLDEQEAIEDLQEERRSEEH
jgi:hypothetical protein